MTKTIEKTPELIEGEERMKKKVRPIWMNKSVWNRIETETPGMYRRGKQIKSSFFEDAIEFYLDVMKNKKLTHSEWNKRSIKE